MVWFTILPLWSCPCSACGCSYWWQRECAAMELTVLQSILTTTAWFEDWKWQWETGGGILSLTMIYLALQGWWAGPVSWEKPELTRENCRWSVCSRIRHCRFLSQLASSSLKWHQLSRWGNPYGHFVDDVGVPVATIGQQIESHCWFPEQLTLKCSGPQPDRSDSADLGEEFRRNSLACGSGTSARLQLLGCWLESTERKIITICVAGIWK